MKRLRLRKIWVVLAVLMLMTPLLSGRLEKSDATAPTETTNGNISSGYTVKFLVSNGTEMIPDDGTSMPRFDLLPVENTGSGFVLPNGFNITAQLSINGEEATNMEDHYTLKWNILVNNVDITNSAVSKDVMTLIDVSDPTSKTTKSYDLMANASGLLRFTVLVEAISKADPTSKLDIRREALITVPLQIYHKNDRGSYYTYGHTTKSTSLDILANNAASADIVWYYYDFKTDDLVKLENPGKGNADGATQTSSLISSMSSGVSVPDDTAPANVFKYTAGVGPYGGISRIVGRIYLNNDSQSPNYIQKTFDLLIKAEAVNPVVNIEYGQLIPFSTLSNDKGNSLEWYVQWDSIRMPTVVELVNNKGIIGRNWGTEKIYLTPVPAFNKWEFFSDINETVKDEITFTTAFAILKGDVESAREKADSYEVLDVNGYLTLATNVKGENYHYDWSYNSGVDSSGDPIYTSILDGSNPYLSAERGTVVADNSPSSIKLKGKTSGIVELKCTVTGGDIIGSLEQIITIKVVDSITLSDSMRTLAVNDTFDLTAYTSTTGTITWTSSDDNFVTVEPTGSTVKVTGVAVTGNQWITITATQVSSGRTAICRVKVVDELSPVRIVGDTVIAKGATGNLELEFEGAIPNYSKDDLEWIVKDKGNVASDTILKLEQNQADVTKAVISGLEAGEVYVAVVLNEVRGGSTVKTELAVETIKVVTPPEALELSEHEVIGYLDQGTHTLTATIQPKGYVDEDLIIEWRSSDESIATVVGNEDHTAVVTYHNIGRVIITATVKGVPLATDACHYDIQNPAGEITLSAKDLTMKVGDTKILEATIQPDNVTDTSLTWNSSSPDIASVDRTGIVKALNPGSTIITCTTSNGLKATCTVTVLKPVEKITLNYDNITVKKGTIFYLSAQVEPIDAYDKSVTYSSSDESIVTVDQDGTVTAVKVGTAEITVTSKDNPEVSAVCVVSVTESVSGITLNVKEKTIDVGEQFQLIATVRPSDSLNRNVTWTSSDPTIASVDENGLVTGIKGGKVIIMAKTEERGLMASCTITVQQDIEQIILSDTELYVGKGKTKKINYTLVPETATKKKLIWKSSNEGIAIVDADGNVHGVNLGTTTITATSQDDGKVKVTCKVTVINEAQTVTLNQTIIRIMEGEKYDLTATISPAGASVQKITWSTSDAAVARVDSMGRVTAVREGECTVRAAAADGGGAYGECRVIVTAAIPTTSVTVDSTETTMVVGDTRTMTARVLPRNTTESIRWVSGDTSVVTIDNNGNMKAVGPGVCKVTAISSSSGIEGVSTVTVLGLNAMSITLEQYDSFDLYLDGVPNGITWFSRNKRVASVTRGGVVTARMPGTTNVVARVNGKLVSCEITVEKIKK